MNRFARLNSAAKRKFLGALEKPRVHVAKPTIVPSIAHQLRRLLLQALPHLDYEKERWKRRRSFCIQVATPKRKRPLWMSYFSTLPYSLGGSEKGSLIHPF